MTNMTKRLAIYPGSFDPLTLGHLDVIKRAARLFDRLMVAIGEARDKHPLFSVEERIEIMKLVCKDISNVEVQHFKGLSTHFARSAKAITLVRGIRSTSDAAYEMQMAHMNKALTPEIDTIFLPTSPEYSHISSSLAKEIARYEGDLTLLVPALVSQRLAAKIAIKTK